MRCVVQSVNGAVSQAVPFIGCTTYTVPSLHTAPFIGCTTCTIPFIDCTTQVQFMNGAVGSVQPINGAACDGVLCVVQPMNVAVCVVQHINGAVYEWCSL